MAEEPLPITESTTPGRPETENSQYRYQEVNMGHSHSVEDFDRDQALCLGFARLAGLVDPNAHIRFVTRIPYDDLENPRVLNLEGFSLKQVRKGDRTNANNPNANNFRDDPVSQDPAAFMLASAFHREYARLVKENKLRPGVVDDIKYWLKAVEGGDEEQFTPAKVKVLKYDDLRDYSTLFYAIKHAVATNDFIPATDKATATIERTNELFDRLVQSSKDSIPLRDYYADALQEYKKYLDQQREAQTAFLRNNPDRLRTTTTQTGLHITYVDVRGTDFTFGTFGIATRLIKDQTDVDTDIVMLINDEKDALGDRIGAQIKIAIPKARKDALRDYDLRDLGERLSISEHLFGAGTDPEKNTEYDGHQHFIGSPQGEGTQLDPQQVYIAVQEYFNQQRFLSRAQIDALKKKESDVISFEDRARAFAARLNKTTLAFDTQNPKDPYHIAQHTVAIGFSELTRSVIINEDEFALYESVFTDDRGKNQQIVLAKTDVSQHPAITQERNRNAAEALSGYLTEKNAPMALEAFDQMDQATIEGLPDTMLLTLFTLIARDPVAISNVWNKDDMRFRIKGQKLPDWIANDPEQYKAAKYSFQSLPSTVDSYLTARMQRFAAESTNPELQRSYAQTMTDILCSPVYRDSHQFASDDALVSYDTHLQSVLRMISDERFSEDVRRVTAQRVFETYGKDMHAHWKRVAQIDQGVVLPLMEQYTEQFEPILDAIALNPETLHHPIEDVPNSNSIAPNEAALRMHLAAQAAEGIKPTATILVEVGRSIEDLLRDMGIVRIERTQQGESIKEKIYASDSLVTTGLLRLQDEERPYEEADDPKVARAIVAQVKNVADMLEEIDPSADIRIVEGGFPLPLVDELREQLMTSDLDPSTKKRIVLCFYNPLKKIYYDRRLIKQKAA